MDTALTFFAMPCACLQEEKVAVGKTGAQRAAEWCAREKRKQTEMEEGGNKVQSKSAPWPFVSNIRFEI
jgi:hypothetical protein